MAGIVNMQNLYYSPVSDYKKRRSGTLSYSAVAVVSWAQVFSSKSISLKWLQGVLPDGENGPIVYIFIS